MSLELSIEDKNRRKVAGIITAVIAILMIFFMWLIRAYNTYDPALSPEGAVIEFGTSQEGFGESEAEIPQNNPEPQEQASTTASSAQESEQTSEEVVTDENSDIEVDQNEEQTENNSETNEPTAEELEAQRIKEEKDRKRENAWNTPSSGDGENKDQEGNEGKEDGDKNSKGVLSNGIGAFGAGSGRYVGGSIKVIEEPTESGEIVLDIYVDNKGNYLRSEFNMGESKSTSNYLINLAKKSAERTAKFDADPTSPVEQKISVRFIFKLK
ncbi:MAG: hypothetical protein AAF487_12750 [Bacteroidota bacterium]